MSTPTNGSLWRRYKIATAKFFSLRAGFHKRPFVINIGNNPSHVERVSAMSSQSSQCNATPSRSILIFPLKFSGPLRPVELTPARVWGNGTTQDPREKVSQSA